MIKVTRSSIPTILNTKSSQWTDELCKARQKYYADLKDYEQGKSSHKPDHPDAVKSRYGHEKVKQSLQNMFGTKCAYCESPVTAVSYQHVEHFRPQSIYPMLAYDWNNLLLACSVCNSGFKRDQFPLVNGTKPSEDPLNPCSLDDSDNNALINPCIDDPQDFFTFSDEWVVCRGRKIRAIYTRDICGLNREYLKDERKKLLVLIEMAAKYYLAVLKDSKRAEGRRLARKLKKYVAPTSNYSAMVKAKLASLGIDTNKL